MTQPSRPQQHRTSLEIVPMRDGLMAYDNAAQIEALCQRFANSPLAPAKLRGNPDGCFAVVTLGMELGLSAAMSLQSIHFIEDKSGTGKPYIPGDVYLAVMENQPELEGGVRHGFTGEEFADDYHVWVETRRKGQEPQRTTYSVADAKRAGLWGRRTSSNQPTNWITHPKDMLFWKAVARHGRRCWADKMKGLLVREDLNLETRIGPERAVNITPVKLDLPAPAGLLELQERDPMFDVDVEPAGEPAGEGGTAESEGDSAPASPADSDGLEYEAKLGDLVVCVAQRAQRIHEELRIPLDVAERGVRAHLRAAVKLDAGDRPTLEQIEQMLELAPNAVVAQED